MMNRYFALKHLVIAFVLLTLLVGHATAKEPDDGIQTDPPDIPRVRLENSKGMVRAVFSKDGKYVIGWCSDGKQETQIGLWETKSGKLLSKRPDVVYFFLEDGTPMMSQTFVEEDKGRGVISNAMTGKKMAEFPIYEMTVRMVRRIDGPIMDEHHGLANGARLVYRISGFRRAERPNGTFDFGRTDLMLLRVSDADQVYISFGAKTLNRVQVSRGSRRCLVEVNTFPQAVILWNTATGNRLLRAEYQPKRFRIDDLVMNRDGTVIGVMDESALKADFWNAEQDEFITQIHLKEPKFDYRPSAWPQISTDGNLLTLGAAGLKENKNLVAGQSVDSSTKNTITWSFEGLTVRHFSYGNSLVLSSKEGYSVLSGEKITLPKEFREGKVSRLSIANEGFLIAGRREENRVSAWELWTRHPLFQITGPISFADFRDGIELWDSNGLHGRRPFVGIPDFRDGIELWDSKGESKMLLYGKLIDAHLFDLRFLTHCSSETSLAQLWDKLSSDSAPEARGAIFRLTAKGDDAVQFLKQKLQVQQNVSDKQLILTTALNRQYRSVEVLARIGTDQAKRVLEHLAQNNARIGAAASLAVSLIEDRQAK